MVPYVRKSFFKHFTTGLKYIDGIENLEDGEVTEDTPIDDKKYKTLSARAYEYAMDETKKELKQAVEGMYHNLK